MVEPGPKPLGTLEPLSTLVARPPTPPKQSHRNDGKPGFISRLFYGGPQSHSSRPALSSITPSSSGESPARSPNTSAISRKKVEWSDSTEYNDPPKLPRDGPVVPLSAERKPLKSILKAYNGAQEQDHNGLGTNTKLLPPHHHSSLAIMLESIVQQLAGKDRNSKMDAYLMLSSSLKASENSPDLKALDSRMSLLLQFITRDISEKNEAGKSDTPLVTNALTLLSSFLHKQTIRDSITNDFSVFIVEYAIKTFHDPQMSKEIVKHLMFVLAQQKFPPRIMNTERVGKLITALHNIEIHITGKSIVMGRQNIYRTLLRQSRSHMVAHPIWIEDLFIDMLSSIKEIRTMAIIFGLESSYGLGGDIRPSRSVSNFFQIDRSEGIKFADYYCGCLKQLLQKKQDTACVPQIWSVIVLFLRANPKQLEQWPFLTSYLEIVQQCFNSSDPTTRIEANYAWNRFVFAVGLNERTPIQMIRMLCKPLAAQLLRLRKKSSASRKAVLGSLCNLLYYSFKPTSTPVRLDLFWDEYIVPLVGQSLTPANITDNPNWAKPDLLDAGRVLQSLFDSTNQRPWDDSRAMANLQRNSVDAKELPALDPKWLRKNPSRVFVVLAPILERLYWDLGAKSETATIWQTYITSIASPASMEVKVSNDTMASLASIFGLLYQIWHTGPFTIPSLSPPSGSRTPEFLKSFERLLIPTIEGLGILPFTERMLCVGTQDTFIPVATPSHRPEKLKGEVRSPLYHLFSLLTTISPGLEYDGRFLHMVHSIFLPFFELGKSSMTSRIDLAKDLLHLIPQQTTQPCKLMWRVLANFTTTATDTRDDDKSNRNIDQPLGVKYRGIVKVLEVGVNLSPQEPLPGWETLLEASIVSASIDAGDAGRAIVVIEPLAKCLMQRESTVFAKCHTDGPSYYHLLITKATYPKHRQALDAARKRLWGTGDFGPNASTFDPYSQLYKYIQKSLANAYALYTSAVLNDSADILAVTTALLARCPIELRLGMLMAVQEGISLWVLDSKALLKEGNHLSKEISALWHIICAFVHQMTKRQGISKTLLDLELLICSGLESTHKAIANHAISMWNSTFGKSEEPLVYSTRLKDSLMRLDSVADIQLPFFPESLRGSNDETHGRQPIEFVDSQDDSNNFLLSSTMESVLRAHPTPLMGSSPIRRRLRETTPQVLINVDQSSSHKRSREATPDAKKRKSRRLESTPSKLRHDNSQIQFQAVGSSPTGEVNRDSQLLTARQAEVKERQRIEAAMFPDLRSSPGVNVSTEPELPTHLSPSRSHMKTPPRQTTPDPLPPSEDDSFMISSPTPKRDNHHNLYPSTSLYSPPRLTPNGQRAIQAELGSGFHFEIPSSPPERLLAPDIEPQTAIDHPSALADCFANQDDGAMSTFDSTNPSDQHPLDEDRALKHPAVTLAADPSRRRANSPISVPEAVSENILVETVRAKSSLEAKNNVKISTTGIDLAVADAPFKKIELQQPTTPPRHKDNTDAGGQQLSSPQFVDAMSSPPSSDSINEDIFEDAVSSPRLMVQKTRTSRAWSPLSEFDESSMLRIMKDFDEAPADPSTVVADVKKSPRHQTRASSRKTLLQSPLPVRLPSRGSMRIAVLKNTTATNTSNIMNYGNDSIGLKEPLQPHSSLPSMIPETPATKIPDPLAKIVIDGEELNPYDTIIVDASALENEGRGGIAGRRRRRTPTSAKKRKHEDTTGASGPVLDGQQVQNQATLLTRTSPRKKQRGGSNKALQSSQVHTDASSERSHSVVSADVDVSMSAQDVEVGMAGVLLPSAEEPSNGNKDCILDVNKPPNSIALELLETPSAQEPSAYSNASPHRGVAPAEVIEETILGASSMSVGNSRSPPVEQDNIPLRAGAIVSSEIIGTPADSPTLTLQLDKSVSPDNISGATPSPPPPTPSDQPFIPMFQSVKEKVQSLVRDLGLAVFSRDQVNEIEDIFMDAKAQLYAAAMRGRLGGDP
ncbi:uncharacterized protein BP5553_00852 [Venustampulla echinocandica]|uniref:Telomere-associated protein Rif1 N-terminal domain-containing protein n=1 Tax=Venustampulla echinocandica TaxID=2656787 RepID=A0A370TZA8_9HELO|nr:uncharacterized protein BP5553_00852 [Venustampulla echinocandica]RDL40873.1 hypothetical protein BP5553_00852 [Venustampulla echinocandica]